MKPIRKNQIERGWMLKMAGISNYSKVDLIVGGKYGQYIVKNHIDDGGKGGNHKKSYDNYL